MAENEFNISILKVGQADAIIFKTENHTAVIDCGENPAEEICVNALKAIGSDIYYTKDGDIYVLSDGADITILQ